MWQETKVAQKVLHGFKMNTHSHISSNTMSTDMSEVIDCTMVSWSPRVSSEEKSFCHISSKSILSQITNARDQLMVLKWMKSRFGRNVTLSSLTLILYFVVSQLFKNPKWTHTVTFLPRPSIYMSRLLKTMMWSYRLTYRVWKKWDNGTFLPRRWYRVFVWY